MTNDSRRGNGTTTAARAAADVTPSGAAWLTSASPFPRSVRALWSARPSAPTVLPTGTVFDVVSLPDLYARRVLDLLWTEGPGSGPVAALPDRIMIFAAPGTADRLPALLRWEEWGRTGSADGQARSAPAPLCHGQGDAVTIPPLQKGAARVRWLVAPEVRYPWLPGPQVLLWACTKARTQVAEGAEAAPDPTPRANRFSISADRVLEFSRHQAPLAQLVRAADS
ncbi:bifunctional DNA primase/polymerase [Streptomyces boninensis]|uniref:bifunctional DNA primase/polymerase n=1 Tax=Streptomyces boninensis TaxID=2039455 RepID=UPI003B220AE1